MKIGQRRNGEPVRLVVCGECFMSERTSDKTRMGYYMRIDGNSGMISRKPGYSYAVNLETGQLRAFAEHTTVYPIDAELMYT